MQVLENFNWIDIVIILLLLRYAYIGARLGLTAELFKLLGTIVAIVTGLHIYQPIATALVKYVNAPIWLAEFIIIIALAAAIKIIVRYGVILLFKILNIQFISKLERAGGALVGIANGLLVIGLVLLAVLFIPVEYFYTSVNEKSRIAPYLTKSAEATYTSIIRLFPSQEPRKTIAELQKVTARPSKK